MKFKTLFLAPVFVILLIGNSLSREQECNMGERNLLPSFTLKDINGRHISYDDILKGKVIYVTFWATWCRPCVKELHEIKKIYRKHKDKGFEVIAISIDDVKTQSRVKPFVKSQKYDFTVLMDKDKKYYKKFLNPTPPYSILVNRKGEIVKVHHGFLPGDEIQIEKEILELLS